MGIRVHVEVRGLRPECVSLLQEAIPLRAEAGRQGGELSGDRAESEDDLLGIGPAVMGRVGISHAGLGT